MPQTGQKHEFFAVIAVKDLRILGIDRKPAIVDNFVHRIVMTHKPDLSLKQ